jgi:hypothetical protein
MNYSFNFWKCGAHGGMILTGENRRTRRKTCPSATLSTTNLTGVTWARTQAAAVRGRRLTPWAMARPFMYNKGTHRWRTTSVNRIVSSQDVYIKDVNVVSPAALKKYRKSITCIFLIHMPISCWCPFKPLPLDGRNSCFSAMIHPSHEIMMIKIS